MRQLPRLAALLVAVGLAASTAAAASPPLPEPSAVFDTLSWRTLSADLTFTVKREGATPLERRMEVRAEDTGADGQRLLATFTEPAHMRGTAFLAHAKADGEDDYYLYLRTLRRVKRVPRGSDNFMLRDFMSLYFLKPRTELWRFEWEPTAAAPDGQAVLRGSPRIADVAELTGYAALRHYVELETLRIVGTDFLDAKGAVVRRQRVTAFSEAGGVAFPARFDTADVVEGAHAEVTVRSLELDRPISDGTFSVRSLKRR